MNKYSSKAIKTAATVGMSLAMVLSAVPATPVFAAYAVSTETNVLTNAWSDFKSDVLTLEDLKTITSETEISKEDYNKFMSAVADSTGDPFTAVDVDQVLFDLLADNTTANTFGKIVANSVTKLTGEVRAYVKEMQTIYTKVTDMTTTNTGILDVIDGKLKNSGIYTDGKIEANIDAAIADLEALDEFEADYYNNLTAAQQETFDTVKGKLNSQVSSVAGTDYDTKLSAYVKELTKAYEEFVKDNQDGTITKPMVNSVLSWIKDGKTKPTTLGTYDAITKANYKRFADDSDVQAVIDDLNNMLDEIAEVATVVNSTKNDSYKAYITGTNSVKKKIQKLITGKDTNSDKYNAVEAGLKLADWEILKAFKEDVVDNVYTIASKKYASRYYDDSSKSLYATTAQVNTVLGDFLSGTIANPSFLLTLDTEDGTFAWDSLEAHMNKVNDSLKALEDLSKYDAITLSVNDKDALVKMDDAVYFLQNDGSGNLNSAQTRTVRDAARKVTELMEAYRKQFGSIDSTVNGWVNKGNGDWAYYENGNAVTKWVASGSDWYYVRGGVMLRNSWIASDSQGTKWYYVDDAGKMVSNTTVNGYTFNSYGVWVK